MNHALTTALLKASLMLNQPWLDHSGIDMVPEVGIFDCGGVQAHGCFTVTMVDGRQRGIMRINLSGPYRQALAHESIHAVRWLSGESDWYRHDKLTRGAR